MRALLRARVAAERPTIAHVSRSRGRRRPPITHEMDLLLEPTVAGAALAAAAVAGGAPLFGDGLRAMRLSACFRRVRESAPGEARTGFVHVHGRAQLESPLFSPLTGRPCAAFRLEVGRG